MKYDNEEWVRRIEKANAVSIVAYCDHAGIAVVPFGSEYRHKDYDSLKIRDNKWKRWSGKTELLGRFTQGYPIQFVMEYEGVGFETAIEKLLAFCAPDELPLPTNSSRQKQVRNDHPFEKRILNMTPQKKIQKKEEEQKSFVKPNKHSNNEAVYTYLTKTRCIDPELVKEQLRLGLLYESAPYHNCVFLGLDNNGNPAYGFQRGTQDDRTKKYAREVGGSRKEWIWNYAPDREGKRLFVFEAAIDALSFVTFHMNKGEGWKHAHYLPLGGVEDRALVAYLQRNPHIESITFCLDHDEAGEKATDKFLKIYSGIYCCGSMPPPDGFKDWNEYLVAVKTRKGS